MKYGYRTLKGAGILSNVSHNEIKYKDLARTSSQCSITTPAVDLINSTSQGTSSTTHIGDLQKNLSLIVYNNLAISHVGIFTQLIIYSGTTKTAPTLALLFSDPTRYWISPRLKEGLKDYKIVSAKHYAMDPDNKTTILQMDHFKKFRSKVKYELNSSTIKTGSIWLFSVSSLTDAQGAPYLAYNARYSFSDS